MAASQLQVSSYSKTASRRLHDRVDLSRHQIEAWLVKDGAEHASGNGYCACRLLNLSYSGMCLHGEDLFQVGREYRFILDLLSMLGTEVEVTARVVWKEHIGAGLCYAGAVFVKSSAPWLGPDEEDDPRPADEKG
ncbi:MAG: PilZ domain-containing protein [Acidobacteria bacterium]|nr:PilZ domain-containing protein [Acidobacteriota bacterium]